MSANTTAAHFDGQAIPLNVYYAYLIHLASGNNPPTKSFAEWRDTIWVHDVGNPLKKYSLEGPEWERFLEAFNHYASNAPFGPKNWRYDVPGVYKLYTDWIAACITSL